MNDIKKYIDKYDKKYEHLIIDCLKWLERNEPLWNLNKKINKETFIEQIIKKNPIT